MAKWVVLLPGALACFVFFLSKYYKHADGLQIVGGAPANGATDVSLFTVLTVTFNNPLDATATIASFTLMSLSGTVVPGLASVANNTFSFMPGVLYQPSTLLQQQTSYLMSFAGATDIHGNRLDANIIFTTRSGDPNLPTLTYSDMSIATKTMNSDCRGALCSSQPGIDPFAPDFPCPEAKILTDSNRPVVFSLDYWSTPRAQILYFMFPYGKGSTWPCGDLVPTFFNFTVPLPPFSVRRIDPPNGQENVALNWEAYAEFSWPPTSFSGTARVEAGPIVPGSWTNNTGLMSFWFTPIGGWPANATIVVSIVAIDQWDRRLSFPIRFTTTAYPAGPPQVTYIYPPRDGSVAPPQVISINFNKPMDATSVERGFSLLQLGSGARNGSLTWRSDFELAFRPFDALASGQTFAVTLVGARDRIDRLRLPDFASMFHTTGPSKPSVVDTWPQRDAVSVPRTLTVNITFSMPMNATSVQNGFLLMVIGGGRSSGTFAWRDSNSTLLYKPSAVLPPNRSMILSIVDAQSESQQTLPDFSYSFHTGETAWKSKVPVEDARRIPVSMHVVD